MGGGSSPAGRAERPRGRTPPATFERLYRADADPWRYATDPYEQDKYRRTLAALGERRFVRALEVGCSIGVFTAMLAPRCDVLIALDPSPTALARASDRLQGHRNAQLVAGAVPEGLPDGPLDLVVCSEVLYYLSAPLLIETLQGIEQRLAAGGTLVVVHFRAGRLRRFIPSRTRRPSPPAPLTGDQVHLLVREHTRLSPVRHERRARYLLDRFDAR
jgi:SAM-dependent methyltransferase